MKITDKEKSGGPSIDPCGIYFEKGKSYDTNPFTIYSFVFKKYFLVLATAF